MSLNLRSSGVPLIQNELDNNLTFLYSRDITGSTVTGTTLFLYKQDGTVLTTQLPSNSGGTGVDTFTTGFTYSNNNLTISRNQGQPSLTVTINNFTGLTINGSLSASTYLGLPQFVTGGTYSAGTLSLLTNGSVVNVTGFSKTINVETIEWQDDQTVDYTKKAGIDDPVIFFDSSNNSFDSPSSITVTLDPNLSFTSSDVGKRNWKMIFPSIQRVDNGNTWIVKQGGSGVTSVNLVEYKSGRVTPHVLEFWWDPNFSGGRYRIAKYELEEAENDATTVDPAIGLNFYSKIKFAGQIWGGASYGNSGGSTIIPAGAIIYVKDVIILNQGTITPTGTTIAIGLSTVNNGGSLGSSLTTSTSLTDFGVQSNDSRLIFKNPRPASYYNSGSGGVGNANMFFVDNTIGTVRTSVPVMITLTATTTLTDGVVQVYVPYMVIQPRLSGTPYTLIDNTYDLWVTESNWSALNSGGTSTTIIQQFTGNTSASCISNLYVSNIFGCSPLTIHDSIQSVGSIATGLLSTALGSGTQAIGNYSHAEGINTQAIGDYSHAEGHTTIATGDYSHTEGSGTTAGDYSHAEGFFTQANGITSHAEGNRTIAVDYSHAEGLLTQALNDYSHAEGHSSIASGAGSHAQNYFTVASGQFSHAEGRSSRATGFTSHAEGFFTVAGGSHSHSEGEYTIARGITSHAEGSGTTAIGNYSHAEGQFTIASGNTSHAEGLSTQANGIASHTEGINTKTIGDYSHAEGNSTEANGFASHAEGDDTQANGDASHAEGYRSIANGDYSHAEGNSTADGDYSHAEGSSNAVGNYSHAEGNSIANGEASHSEGGATSADGDYSHAEGSGTQSIGDYSHSEGESTQATGIGSHAEGSTTNAIGDYSHVEGTSTISTGTYSHAEGRSTESIGEASHSEGNRTIATGNYSHAGGYQSGALNYAEFARSSSNGSGLYGQHGIFTIYGTTTAPGDNQMLFGDGTQDILLIDDSAYRFDIKGVAISDTGGLASFDDSLTLKIESGLITFCPSGNSKTITSVCGDMTGATISLSTGLTGTTFRARYTSTVTGNTTLNATFNYTQVYKP